MDALNLSSLQLTDTKKAGGAAKAKASRTKKKQASEATPSKGNDVALEIVAFSQQSRFHRETFDASSIDIDIKGVNVSVNNKELLVDAHLRLKPGVRYGMVGQNGVGKSGPWDNVLVGLPQNVRILHIAQLEEITADRTILEELLSADIDRTRIIKEAQALQGFSSKSASDSALNTIIHSLLVSRAETALETAQKIATKRSGQRGHTARQALLVAESEFATIRTEDPQTIFFGAYAALDVEGDEARAKGILRGLGFKDDDLNKEGRQIIGLSGGWRMRVMLGKALFMKPDILLLDEPTNHLDLPANCLVEGQTVVVVSHDRNFLDAVTDETIIFRNQKLSYHPGNYDDWERNTEEQRKRKSRVKELEQKRRKRIMDSIQKSLQMAKSTGDDKRHGLVTSRKRVLERMGMDRLEDGKRYKESYHGFREAIVVDQGVKTAPIQLPPPEPFNFPGSSFLQLSEVSFRYDPKPSARMVISNVSLDVGPQARIGLLGPNGCGKSTLMNLLAGELKPAVGEVKKHHRLRIGYFSQHTVDQLELSLNALQQLAKTYPDIATSEGEARSHFGSCGISGDPVTRPIRTLSGGQRNRVALALVTYHRPHVLLLDEITNHLDMGTVESLVESLCEFEGALVVVSHDVWFLKQVIDGGDDDDDGDAGDGEREKGVLYTVTKTGELKRWEKGLDAYVEKIHRLASKGAHNRGVK
ncbi:P-loop containing nucleoside triphosphate hydrolase protein [Gymnopilus junonius]|uniref:P-loop containing nucleoside triphosphate hydrolase protein n=1 Tax=Gymnopilus junonius TaxID=109634 RepID=A0A9P5TLH6_GYMJU|nr:P-loop containing nucleoside triphosphate hydrolase protein [Gymnopilus junonius]